MFYNLVEFFWLNKYNKEYFIRVLIVKKTHNGINIYFVAVQNVNFFKCKLIIIPIVYIFIFFKVNLLLGLKKNRPPAFFSKPRLYDTFFWKALSYNKLFQQIKYKNIDLGFFC